MRNTFRSTLTVLVALVAVMLGLVAMPTTSEAVTVTGRTLLDEIDLDKTADKDGEGWTWDAGTQTLTLTDCDLWFSERGFDFEPGVDAKIVVSGNCTIVTAVGGSLNYGWTYPAFGVVCQTGDPTSSFSFNSAAGDSATLTLGSGYDCTEVKNYDLSTVTALISNYSNEWCKSTITIQNLDVVLTGEAATITGDNVKVEDSSITVGARMVGGVSFPDPASQLLSSNGDGATGGSLVIDNTAITGTFKDPANVFEGDSALDVVNGSVIDLELPIESFSHRGTFLGSYMGAYGLNAITDLKIEDSEVSLIFDASTYSGDAWGDALIGIDVMGNLVIEDSTVTVSTAESSASIPGSKAIHSVGTMTINNSKVTATAASENAAYEVLADQGLALTGCAVRQGTVQAVNTGTAVSQSDASATTPAGGTVLIDLAATDATVASVTVAGSEATLGADGSYSVELPAGSAVPAASDIVVTPTDANATVSTPVTSDGGRTWTLTVTAEDGATTSSYTLHVSVPPAPTPGPSTTTDSGDTAASQDGLAATADPGSAATLVALLAVSTGSGALLASRRLR